MRPATIAWFERLYILFAIASFLMRFRRVPLVPDEFGQVVTFTLLALSLIIPMALALFVSRRRSRVALIFLLLITWALGLVVVTSFASLERHSPADLVELVLAAALMALTLLLVTPSARAWLRASADPPPSPEKLKRTFE